MFAFSTLIIALLAVAGGSALGWRLGARRDVWKPAAVLVAIITAWFITHAFTDLSYRLIPWREWVFFQRAALTFPILALVGLCLRNLKRRLLRIALTVIAIWFALASILDIASPLVFRGALDALDGDRSNLKPVSQTSGWSCGAAATATFLRLHGVPTSEREVAILAGTSPIRGTDTRGDCRAVDVLGAPYGIRPRLRIHLHAADIDTIRPPCILEWKLYPTLWHVAVITSIRGDAVDIEDPLLGHDTWTRQQLLDKWLGTVIEAE